MSQSPTFVYFVATEDRSMVKIGCSNSPLQRMESLYSWSPVKLALLAHVPGTLRDEYALHRRYIAHYSHKEWFFASPEMLADVEAIRRFGELPSSFRGSATERNAIMEFGGGRKRLSEIHRDRHIRKKRWKPISEELTAYMVPLGLTGGRINSLIGLPVFNWRFGRFEIPSAVSVETMDAVEAFLAAEKQKGAA